MALIGYVYACLNVRMHARWMMNCMSPVFMCKPVLELHARLLVLIMEWYVNEWNDETT